MNILTVVGAEDGHLILVSGDGERFSVAITPALTNALRPPTPDLPTPRTASPKEIQAHIRRGLTATQVADLTGEDVSYIQKFEGAVVAERDFIVTQALTLSVARKDGSEVEFRDSVLERLREIRGTEVSWSAWKEATGWMVELAFLEGDVEHQARWSFEPRKHVLKPQNEDATVLSRHEPMPDTLIPKLSAVANTNQPERFDSGIFEDSDLGETGPLLEPVPYGRQGEGGGRMADTTDLLEALRKKRGEREAAPDHDSDFSRNAHPSTGGIRLVDDSDDHDASVTPIQAYPDEDDDPEPPPTTKTKRPQMPSWDDIVFGARGDEDQT